ncbi:decapping mRNA 1B L homeolog isoform X2 [Xenopus laevis]|uniref:5'-(N(7)-methylguanosine 5'-triphospho)-[mRNA] hydrolase n=1 Tax=Xenopus laevis TaxID=8355 RepID=A0A8J0U7Q2_XENLA|nr:decapping mRNA 1B L homeolog isoform X2 [Xenopus laevis]
MASCGSAAVDRGFEMSLAALRLNDPHIKAIVDVASQVALYTFSHNANEWEKTDVEGTLYVYTRSSSPQYGFTIMNSLSMENRTEPITKDLDFQIQDPFLLYRNARFFIYGIWFYDQEERQRIADLIKHLTRHERLNAQHGAACGGSPMTLDSGEGQGVDILHMLTKAMDEYNKAPESEKQHLSLTALFGKPDKAQEEARLHSEPGAVRHSVVRSLSYEEPWKVADNVEKELCPAIQKLMVAGGELQPVSEIPENRPYHNGSYPPDGEFFPGLFKPVTHQTPFSSQDYESGKHLLQTLHTAQVVGPKADMVPSCTAHSLNYLYSSLQSQRSPASLPPLTSEPVMAYGTISPQELLKKLNLVRQEQQIQSNPRPALAAKFPVVSQSCGFPKISWMENIPGGEKQNLLLQASSPQCIPASLSSGRLMSPLVFAQPSRQTRTNGSANLSTMEPSNLLFPTVLLENPVCTNTLNSRSIALTRSQLQEALLQHIQNDDNFLNTIYEAYLSSQRRGGTGRRQI